MSTLPYLSATNAITKVPTYGREGKRGDEGSTYMRAAGDAMLLALQLEEGAQLRTTRGFYNQKIL
jgi:hypothetical protein